MHFFYERFLGRCKSANLFHWKLSGVQLGFQLVEVHLRNGNSGRDREVNNLGIWSMWVVEHFGIFPGKGG